MMRPSVLSLVVIYYVLARKIEAWYEEKKCKPSALGPCVSVRGNTSFTDMPRDE